jgi:hypothetical protein
MGREGRTGHPDRSAGFSVAAAPHGGGAGEAKDLLPRYGDHHGASDHRLPSRGKHASRTIAFVLPHGRRRASASATPAIVLDGRSEQRLVARSVPIPSAWVRRGSGEHEGRAKRRRDTRIVVIAVLSASAAGGAQPERPRRSRALPHAVDHASEPPLNPSTDRRRRRANSWRDA